MIELEGTTWFPAKDICDLLGIGNARMAARNACDEAHYCTIKKSALPKVNGIDVSFPNRGMLCVSEAGIYDLIDVSKTQQAKDFRKWVHGTVLPAIRKDGGYVMGEEKVATGEMSEDELVLKAMQVMQGKIERMKLELDAAKQETAHAKQETIHAKQEQRIATNMIGKHERSPNQILRTIY